MQAAIISAGDRIDDWAAWTAEQVDLQVWVKDLRSRFVSVSGPLARWCGVAPGDMVGRTEVEFFPHERVRQFRRDDVRVVALDQPVVVEETCPPARFATLKRPVRDDRGRVCGTVGIAHDWPGDGAEAPVADPACLPVRNRPPSWLRDIRLRMQRDFRSALSVQRLAEEARRHPNHVSRAFRLYFGVSTCEWLHRLRVVWVAEALLSADIPLSALAQRAGFADQAHLTRVFKRYYGLTPAQYRRAASAVRSAASGHSDW